MEGKATESLMECRCTSWKHFIPQPGAALCDCGAIHAGLTADGKSGIVVRVFRWLGTDSELQQTVASVGQPDTLGAEIVDDHAHDLRKLADA